jgi:hypothetical protein
LQEAHIPKNYFIKFKRNFSRSSVAGFPERCSKIFQEMVEAWQTNMIQKDGWSESLGVFLGVAIILVFSFNIIFQYVLQSV